MNTFVGRYRKVFLFVLACLLALILTSCGNFHLNLQETIDVNADGSGTMGVALGMTQELKSLLSSQGANLTQELSSSLSKGSADGSNVKVTQWVDGDYSWVKAEKDFKSLNELNNSMQSNSVFQHFMITKTVGILQDEFTLDAELAPLSRVQNPNNGSSLIDPSAFIQFQVSVSLPGQVTQTNGVVNANDPAHMVWDIQSKQPVSMNATSTTWDWLNIGAISFGFIVGAIGLVVLLIGLAPSMFGSSGKYLNQTAKRSSVEPASSNPILDLHDDVLEGLGIDDLLRQVNIRVLHNIGRIYKKPNEMILMWNDSNSQQRFIDIEARGDGTILIDGQTLPATRESAKSGILAAMKKHGII